MATKNRKTGAGERFKDVARNRRALHEYEITDRVEAGLVLQGSEVKGLRDRGATISDAYVQIRGGEAWLVGAHISEYDNAGYGGHDPRRTRKLLLHRREIERLASALAEKGLSLVPLRLYFSGGGPRSSWVWAAARRSTTSGVPWPSATPSARPTGPSRPPAASRRFARS